MLLIGIHYLTNWYYRYPRVYLRLRRVLLELDTAIGVVVPLTKFYDLFRIRYIYNCRASKAFINNCLPNYFSFRRLR